MTGSVVKCLFKKEGKREVIIKGVKHGDKPKNIGIFRNFFKANYMI